MTSLEFTHQGLILELSYIFYIGGRINGGELCSEHIHLCHNDPRDNPPASASSVLELQAGTTMPSFPIVILLKQNLQLGLESAFPWGESLPVLGFSSHSSPPLPSSCHRVIRVSLCTSSWKACPKNNLCRPDSQPLLPTLVRLNLTILRRESANSLRAIKLPGGDGCYKLIYWMADRNFQISIHGTIKLIYVLLRHIQQNSILRGKDGNKNSACD